MNEINEVGGWKKISDLGSGAFGVVSLWKNNNTGECIAIKWCKFLSPESLSKRQRERWCEEVRRLAHMDHPNVVRYKPLPLELESALKRCNPTGLPPLSMEYCSLGNLRRQLQMLHNLPGLPETQLRKALKDIAEGAAYLHKLGVTHRDIKPDNVVLQLSPERKDEIVYKLIDLGYAKELGDSAVSFVGTSNYLAPEIIRGEQYGPQVDYWSMGVLAYELTTGTLPFLPELSPIERYLKLLEKSDEDICAYISYSGRVIFSNEIRPECRAGSSLRRHLAIWLRSVLRLDPKRRGKYLATLADTTSTRSVSKQFEMQRMPFECLIQTVLRRVVKLFYGNKMEFYEYEIDNVTLLGTVREWVGHDVKATKPEDVILLLYNPKNTNICLQLTEDQAPLFSVLAKNHHSDSVVVKMLALRRDVSMLQTVAPVAFTKIVREAMTSAKTFNLKYGRALYSQTVYLVALEKETSEMYRACCQWYIEHAMLQYEQELHGAVKKVDRYTDRLVHRMECYHGLHSHRVKNIPMRGQYIRSQLKHYQQLVDCVQRAQHWRHQLKQRALAIRGRVLALQRQAELITTTTLRKYTLDDLYKETITLPERKDGWLAHITGIISKLIRKKHEMVNDMEFKKYASATCKFYRRISNLIDWSLNFNKYLKMTVAALEIAELQFNRMESNPRPKYLQQTNTESDQRAMERSCSVNSLGKDLLAISCEYLRFENQDLRDKFDDVINKSILAHQIHLEYMKMYFTKIDQCQHVPLSSAPPSIGI